MSKNTNLVTIDRDAMVASTFTTGDVLVNALKARTGGTHIEVRKDSDGNEYACGVYQLANPTKDRKEVTITNENTIRTIEQFYNAMAMGDVSVFLKAKLAEQIADTDAIELGYDNAVQFITSLFPLTKTTVENYRRLSRFFITDDLTLKGAIPDDTSISLLNQLVSWVKVDDTGKVNISQVEILFTSGILTPYMKQAEYKARLAYIKDRGFMGTLDTLNSEQIASLKEEVVGDSARRHDSKTKGTGKAQEQAQEQAKEQAQEQANNNTVEVVENPQILAGKAFDTIKALEELLAKMAIDCDLSSLKEVITNYVNENTEEN